MRDEIRYEGTLTPIAPRELGCWFDVTDYYKDSGLSFEAFIKEKEMTAGRMEVSPKHYVYVTNNL